MEGLRKSTEIRLVGVPAQVRNQHLQDEDLGPSLPLHSYISAPLLHFPLPSHYLIFLFFYYSSPSSSPSSSALRTNLPLSVFWPSPILWSPCLSAPETCRIRYVIFVNPRTNSLSVSFVSVGKAVRCESHCRTPIMAAPSLPLASVCWVQLQQGVLNREAALLKYESERWYIDPDFVESDSSPPHAIQSLLPRPNTPGDTGCHFWRHVFRFNSTGWESAGKKKVILIPTHCTVLGSSTIWYLF